MSYILYNDKEGKLCKTSFKHESVSDFIKWCNDYNVTEIENFSNIRMGD